MCGIWTDIVSDIWIMIRELLKIIKEAEDMADSQNQRILDFDEKIKKVYRDLKEINEKLNEVNSKNNSIQKD